MLKVYRSLAEAGPEAKPAGVAIGNFDGVHIGHRQLFRCVAAKCLEHGWRPSLLTFQPHPSQVLAPDRAPKLLSTLDERLQMAAGEGIQQAFVLPFDLNFAAMSPQDFVSDVLVSGIGAAAVFVGENFRFGSRQAGDVDLLRQLGHDLGFVVEVVPSVSLRGRTASSTQVRNLIQSGDVSAACRLLERPYSVDGAIVSGHGVGSKQTVPTLNLDTAAEIIPADGVYVTRATDLDDRRTWPAITNIGFRPTFDGQQRTIETFLLLPLTGPAPSRMRVEFLKRVREERRFASPEALKTQIGKDVNRAQTYFRRLTGHRSSLPV